MRSEFLSATAALAISLFATTAAAQTVITFNGASGTPATYTQSGVTFSPATTGALQFSTGPNATTGLLTTGPSGVRPELRADFLSAITGTVAVDLGDFNGDGDTLFLQLFDAGNNSLGFTSLLIDASDTSMHTLSLSASNISYALLGARAPSLSGNTVFADNFSFINVAAAVPEPATWTMMLIGFGAIGASMRRRRRINVIAQMA